MDADFDWELRLLVSFPVLEVLNKASKRFVLRSSQQTSEAFLSKETGDGTKAGWVKSPAGGFIT